MGEWNTQQLGREGSSFKVFHVSSHPIVGYLGYFQSFAFIKKSIYIFKHVVFFFPKYLDSIG